MSETSSRETLRFRDFELDLAAYQLRRNGHPVRLERQPMDLLILLVERRSQLLSHSEIVDRLWGKEVYVDVDRSLPRFRALVERCGFAEGKSKTLVPS